MRVKTTSIMEKAQKIPFNIPLVTGKEIKYLENSFTSGKLSGDGQYTKKCSQLLSQKTGCQKVLLTTSCTHAIEMAALLLDVREGDEIIMPSFTFVSTANPFVLRGGKIVFVDVDPDTMNINANLIEPAITEKTKGIVPIHYAGVACDLEKIMAIAKKYNLFVVEDAAQCIGASYKGKPLGTFGDFGALSFHDTKNIHCGEGGALLINNPLYFEKAEIIREKGTNRAKFLRGEIDKYSWVGIGSSYLPSELNAAFLLAQLEEETAVTGKRLKLWGKYNEALNSLANDGYISLPQIPAECIHNGHIFFIKCKNLEERQKLISYLKQRNIYSVFHYVPLHSAKAGLESGKFVGEDIYTTVDSERLLRLPMYFDLKLEEVTRICDTIKRFYEDS